MFIASAIADDQVEPKELVNEGLDELNTDDLEAYRIDDMLFDKDHYELFLGIGSKNKDRTAISDEKRYWPNGTIPFVFESSLSSYWKNKVRSWASKFNQKMSGCLEIRLVNSRKHEYVKA